MNITQDTLWKIVHNLISEHVKFFLPFPFVQLTDEDFRKAEDFVQLMRVLYTSTLCVSEIRNPFWIINLRNIQSAVFFEFLHFSS